MRSARVSRTASRRRCRRARLPEPARAAAAPLRKVTLVDARAAPWAPNIGLPHTGSGVGMEALASPIAANAMKPPLITNCGCTPKNAGRHSVRSASLPTSTEPISALTPWATAGQIVYLAT